jgi:anthranilate phosphoribosyltransferase
LEAEPKVLERALAEVGLAFLFAPGLHPSMKHVMQVRKELKIRTVFNILGPLANPAFADRMLVGVYDKSLTRVFAEVLRKIGIKRAYVVNGEDGTDEITLSNITNIVAVLDDEIQEFVLDPREYGFSFVSESMLKGGDIRENTEIAIAILNGELGSKRNLVLLNAGVAIALCLPEVDINKGIELAKESIDSGKAKQRLDALVRITNE